MPVHINLSPQMSTLKRLHRLLLRSLDKCCKSYHVLDMTPGTAERTVKMLKPSDLQGIHSKEGSQRLNE